MSPQPRMKKGLCKTVYLRYSCIERIPRNILRCSAFLLFFIIFNEKIFLLLFFNYKICGKHSSSENKLRKETFLAEPLNFCVTTVFFAQVKDAKVELMFRRGRRSNGGWKRGEVSVGRWTERGRAWKKGEGRGN
jgi:hypothetical protein